MKTKTVSTPKAKTLKPKTLAAERKYYYLDAWK